MEADPRLRGDRQSNGGSRHGTVVGGLMSRRSSATSAATVRPGVVSVVLVNYRGAAETITCLRAFDDIDWPADRLELIVVDNDSGDGSTAQIRAAVPGATVVESGSNLGFAGGCNLGVAHATGEYVGLINNDARPDARWIAAAVRAFEEDDAIASVASKVLDWDGKLIDYVDGAMTWFGMGYKREVERPDSPDYGVAKDVLFGTGAAMFVRTEVFRAVGGFDERFFMFYEDVDLGWRLNLLGHRVRYVPGSVAYHRHHVTMKKFGSFRETYLLERNALLAMYKNYDDDTLARALPAAMALAVRRSLARTGTDGDLFPLFREAIEPAYGMPTYLDAHEILVRAFGIEPHFRARQRVLVVTGEPLGERMAGPAIRAWEIAKALAPGHDVILLSTVGARVKHPGFQVKAAGGGKQLRKHTDWADVVVFQGLLLDMAPWLFDSDKILVADVYDPMHLEQLEQAKDLGVGGRATALLETTRILNDQLRRTHR